MIVGVVTGDYAFAKKGKDKAQKRAVAAKTGLAPINPILDYTKKSPFGDTYRQKETARLSQDRAARWVGDTLKANKPSEKRKSATQKLRSMPDTLESVMAKIDADPLLKLDPRSRRLVSSSLWLRQRGELGNVIDPESPGNARGRLNPADVVDVLARLRTPEGKASLDAEIQGVRQQRAMRRLRFEPEDLRDATAKGLTFVRNRRSGGFIPMAEALRDWSAASGQAGIAAVDIGDEGRDIMQAQSVAPLVFGGRGDSGFERFKSMAREEARKQARRKWTVPFEIIGATVNELIRPGHMDMVAEVSRKQMEDRLGRPMTTREERVLREDIRFGQEMMGNFVGALATSGSGASTELADDVLNFFPQVGEASEIFFDPKATAEEKQGALLMAGMAVGIGTQLGRSGLGKAIRAPGEKWVNRAGVLPKGFEQSAKDAAKVDPWESYLESYREAKEFDDVFRPVVNEARVGGDEFRFNPAEDTNYEPGEPVDLVGMFNRSEEGSRRRKMLARLIVDPYDPRLDPFGEKFDEGFRSSLAQALDVEPNEVVEEISGWRDRLGYQNEMRRFEADEFELNNAEFSTAEEFTPWFKNEKTQTWMPVKSRRRVFVSVRGAQIAQSGMAWGRIIEITESLDNGQTLYAPKSVEKEFIGRSRTAKNKGVYARSGSTNPPTGSFTMSEMLTREMMDFDELAKMDEENSRMWVPMEAIRIYRKEMKKLVREASRDVEESLAQELGFTVDEYYAAREYYDAELERIGKVENYEAESIRDGSEAEDDFGSVGRIGSEDSGVGESEAIRIEPAAEAEVVAEFNRNPVFDRDSFEYALKSQPSLNDAQVDAILAVTDARARGHVSEFGGDVDDWYGRKFEAITDEDIVGLEAARQDNSGAVVFKDGRAVIHAFESADVSTFLHEVGHVFERDLPVHEVQLLRKLRGKDASASWEVADREWFADSFTEYLRSGKTRHEGLVAVFEQFKRWLGEIYRTVRGRPDVKVSEDLRGLFDRMLDEQGFGEPGKLRDRVIGSDGAKRTDVSRSVEIDGEFYRLDAQSEKTYETLEADYRAEKRRLEAVLDQEGNFGRREVAKLDLDQLEQEWGVQRRRFATELVNRDLDRRMVFGEEGEGDELFQKKEGFKKMLGIHNVRGVAGVRAAIELGGIPRPSLAITKEGTPFHDFGNVSLVAGREMIDPAVDARNVILDADGYTARQPRAEYKVDRAGLREVIRDLQNRFSAGASDADMVLQNKTLTWEQAQRYLASDSLIKAAYLESVGVVVPKVKREGWSAFGDEKFDEYFVRQKFLDDSNRYRELDNFVEQEFKQYFTDPLVAVGGKNQPYTLENVDQAMGRRVRAQEKTGTQGLPKQRAKLTKQLKSLDAVRARQDSIIDSAEFEDWKQAQEIEWDNFVQGVSKKDGGFLGWATFDDLGDAIGELARGNVTIERLEGILQRRGLEVSGDAVISALDLARGLKDAPTEYFEAKPQRPVYNNEWAGVVVPKGTSEADIAAMREAGFRNVKEYDPEVKGDREAKIQEIAIEDGDVLFQKADPVDRPWYVLKSEQVIEKQMRGPMPGESARAMLANAGVKADELKWTGLDELFAEGRVVTPDEVRARLAEGRVRLEEVRKGEKQNRAAIDGLSKGLEDQVDRARDMLTGLGMSGDDIDKIIDELVRDGDVDLRPYFGNSLNDIPGYLIDQVDEVGYSKKKLDEAIEKGSVDATRYGGYVPSGGGQNYREFLIQWPDGPNPQAAALHWTQDPNVLMHLRTTDADGSGDVNPFLPKGDKALVVEEIQSDWHQAGRRQGYSNENPDLLEQVPWGSVAKNFVPEAPFAKNWHEVGLKRAIRLAAEEGYGEMWWPAGREHAKLYNKRIAENLDEVIVAKDNRTGLVEVMGMKDGSAVMRKDVQESELSDMIGGKMAQEASDKIAAGQVAKFSGENLSIGGAGMEGFYDQMLPSAAKKLVKKFGSSVEKIKVGEREFWRVEVNDAMRKSVMEEGQVLFQKRPLNDLLNRPASQKAKNTAVDVARNVKQSVEKTVAALGNPLDQLRQAGSDGSVARSAGQQLASDVERVLNLSGAHALNLVDSIDQTVKETLGAGYRILPQKRAALNAIAEKAVRGEWGKFTPEETKIWKSWVEVNRALIDEAQARGVMVDRVVDRFVPPQMKGERIWFFDRLAETPKETFGVVEGIVLDGRGNSVAIDVRMDGGEIRRLNQWEKYSSRQLVPPERYFPKVLKDDVYDLLQTGPREGMSAKESAEYEKLMESVERQTGAANRAEAEAIRAEIFDPKSEMKAVTGGVARIERPRIPFELDPEFYETDFYAVVSGHIQSATKRLTMAQVWGQDGVRFAQLAQKLGPEMDHLTNEVKVAIGDTGMLSESQKKLQTLARAEGASQALAKLTGIGTAIVQIGQTAATSGIYGNKAYFQAWAKYLQSASMGVRGDWGEIHRVRMSGAIENSVLEMASIDGASDVAQKLADIGLTVTGVKPVDILFRYHAAMTGRIAAEDAVRALKRGVDGKIVQDAKYRLLKDWMLFDDKAMERLADTKQLTDDDLVMAYHAGAKTQIRNRAADLPSVGSRMPILRVLTRFQQFNYGQVKILGWAAKEAAKGNVIPLGRMVVAYAAVGYVTTELKNEVLSWIEKKEKREVPEDLMTRLAYYVTNGGMFGLFSRVFEGQLNPDVAEGSDAQKNYRFSEDVKRAVVPPIVSDISNIGPAITFAQKTNGGLPSFLDEWARRSVVIYGRLKKRSEPDYSYIDRARRDARKELLEQGYSEGDVNWYLDSVFPTPPPRGATDEYVTYRKNYEEMVKMGYTPGEARSELGPAPQKFAGEESPPDEVPEPDREIEDRIQEDLAAAAQRGGR